MDTRDARPYARWAVFSGAVLLAALTPLLGAGPGTDLDTGRVIASGRAILRGHYEASRPPGAPVHEALVGVLEALGGTVATNAASLAAAAACCIVVAVLLRRHGVAHPELGAAVLAVNPWFLVAATSTVDFPLALALVLGGALALHTGRTWLAGLLFALAIGARMSSVLVVLAAVLAEAVGHDARPRRALLASAVAALAGAAAFLAPFLAAGASLEFARNEFAADSPLVHLGRWGAKNLYLLGPFASVALVAALPAVARSLGSWRSSWLVRFAATGLIATQLLYLRFPWKMGHLVPSLALLAILLAVALVDRPRLLGALVALQLLYAVGSVEVLRPDELNEARSAEATFDLRWGPLVTDVRCRLEDPDAWQGGPRRAEALWSCAKVFGEGP